MTLPDPDSIDSYSYELPDELIAKEPPAERDGARLMVVDRESQSIHHSTIRELPKLLAPGDCLILNDTRVVPARIIGQRLETGGKWEGLFLRRLTNGDWNLIGQTRGRLQAGESIALKSIHNPDSEAALILKLKVRDEDGAWTATPDSTDETFQLLSRYGTVPLPPYMQRKVANDNDWDRYQTTYAETPGSVAAPTAGLHFTSKLLEECSHANIDHARVTLHVGMGTFRPVSVDRLSDHQMHSEWCTISAETARRIRQTRTLGGRIVAVGTTSVRTLETAAQFDEVDEWAGDTDLFIRPPYEFQAVDCLLTNFHLPKSTLFVLVTTLAGTKLIQRAYQEAIANSYRFYSYGDAMLIL